MVSDDICRKWFWWFKLLKHSTFTFNDLIDNVCDHLSTLFQELEPFPEFDMFDDIRRFHQGLCETYSLRAHLLNVSMCCLSHVLLDSFAYLATHQFNLIFYSILALVTWPLILCFLVREEISLCTSKITSFQVLTSSSFILRLCIFFVNISS